METDSQSYRKVLNDQIREVYGKVVYSYTTHIVHAGRLFKHYNCFKWLQLILSGISAAGILTSIFLPGFMLDVISAVMALALFVVTAYFKDSDLSDRYQKHKDTADKLWFVREKYLSLLTDFDNIDVVDIRNRRDSLQQEVSEIYRQAPLTDSKSYSRAQQMLKVEEYQFFSKEELDNMLPECLRESVKWEKTENFLK